MTGACTFTFSPPILSLPTPSHLKPDILCNLVALINDGHHCREGLTKKEIPAHAQQHMSEGYDTAPSNAADTSGTCSY